MPKIVPAYKISPAEAQQIHDLLTIVMKGQPPNVNPQHAASLKMVRSCLCWLLGHTGDTTFEKVVFLLKQSAHMAGVELEDPPPGGPPADLRAN